MPKRSKEASFTREYDSDGRAVIDMNVVDDSGFLCVYSRSDTPIISTDVAEFIEGASAALSPKENLTLKVHSNCIDQGERNIYEGAVRAYYSEKSIANSRELKKNNIIAIILLIFGVAVLAVSLFLSYSFSMQIGAEVIDIVAWVLIWEATDIAIFKNNELRIKKRRYAAYTEMKIVFLEKSDSL